MTGLKEGLPKDCRVSMKTLAGGLIAGAFVAMQALTIGAADAAPVTGVTDALKAKYARPASVPFPEENPYTKEKEDLGRQLFFDPRLSGSDYISCASCHNPAFSWGDGLPTGIGHAMTRLKRRTPTILNLAWGELMMWDGRFDSLEEQALGPMGSAAEMNQDLESIVTELQAIPGYRTNFNVAFPGEGITLESISKAIATFERTIVSGIAPFDRWIAGDEDAIPDAAKRGFVVFNGKANCAACHSGWNFTDDGFHDIGIGDDDVGRGKEVKSVEKMQYAFKTPTLRNIAQRAPYMHNGSLVTLREVVEHYIKGGINRPSRSDEMRALDLTEQDRSDLVAFMMTLTGDDPAISVPRLPSNSQVAEDVLSRMDPAAGPGAMQARRAAPDGCAAPRRHWAACDE